MMKILIEEGKLIIHDEHTINEFMTFIKSEKRNEKYAAEEGYHDDMVMALAIAFAPFNHLKAFDDIGKFLTALRIEDNTIETTDFYSMLDNPGFSDGDSEQSGHIVDHRLQEVLEQQGYTTPENYEIKDI